ncbi:hypothetical protein SDC9_67953 [bioreactor metagenome]|uniref:Uncharacterized protein n=1 Tax=bioreactor metagenome TaxID=1076179 RepID=A0A644XZH3_9ZZZZ
MNEQLQEIILYYFDKKKAGMGFSQIRQELESKGMEKDTVNSVMRAIDTMITEDHKTESRTFRSKELMAVGIFLVIMSIAITLLTYTRIIFIRNYYIVADGPLAMGIGLIMYSVKIKDKQKKRKFKRYFD